MCVFLLTEQELMGEIAHLEREIQQYRVRIFSGDQLSTFKCHKIPDKKS